MSPCVNTHPPPTPLLPHHSSCIIKFCLHVAAGASQWPRYNKSFRPSDPAACSAPTLPAATLCNHCMTHISMVTSQKWPRLRNCCTWSTLASVAAGFCGAGVSRTNADNSLGIRVTSIARRLFVKLTRPHSLLWYSDYMQICDYYG